MTEEDKKKEKQYQKEWAEANVAGDEAGKKAAHDKAEALRANYGYSGGADGSQNISIGGDWISSKANTSYANNQKGQSPDYGTYQSDLDRLTQAQKKYQVAELKKARDKALQNLDEQEQSIKPTYRNARNMTSASSQQGARSFAEYMANRGLTNSGASAQAEINRQSALQNNLGNINTAEANAFRDIANQRTQVNNDYASGVASANAAIQQQYLNNLLNYNEQQRQYIQNLQNQANYQYAGDYQARINELLAQGYSPNSREILELQALRGNKQNALLNAQLANANNLVSNGIINYNTAAGAGMTVPEAQDLYARQQEQAQAQAAWDRYVEQVKLNNAIALNNAQIANYNSQIANRNKTGATSDLVNYSTHKDIVGNRFKGTDEYGDTVYDTQGIANYIAQELADGRISNTDAKSLANNYGLNYYRLTPEYQQIREAMWNTVGREDGEEVLAEFQRLNPSVDDRIFRQLYDDWEEVFK